MFIQHTKQRKNIDITITEIIYIKPNLQVRCRVKQDIDKNINKAPSKREMTNQSLHKSEPFCFGSFFL